MDGDAHFEPDEPRFHYSGPLARQGSYHLDWKQAERNGDIFYRQDHPLAARIIGDAVARRLPTAALTFDYSAHGGVVSVLKPLVGHSGWLELSKLTVDTFETEEFLILAACTDAGDPHARWLHVTPERPHPLSPFPFVTSRRTSYDAATRQEQPVPHQNSARP